MTLTHSVLGARSRPWRTSANSVKCFFGLVISHLNLRKFESAKEETNANGYCQAKVDVDNGTFRSGLTVEGDKAQHELLLIKDICKSDFRLTIKSNFSLP